LRSRSFALSEFIPSLILQADADSGGHSSALSRYDSAVAAVNEKRRRIEAQGQFLKMAKYLEEVDQSNMI
jgi:hypothetical protein